MWQKYITFENEDNVKVKIVFYLTYNDKRRYQCNLKNP